MLQLSTPITKAWNVLWDSKDGNYTSNAAGVHATYEKNGFGSKAGTHFRAAPPKVFPCSHVAVEYKVFFPSDFDFVKGGKLPGVWAGDPGSGGGNWNDDGWSCRVMWREGGEAVAYVYMCTDQGNYDGTAECKLSRNQGDGFDDIAHHTNGSGVDLWRDAGLQFKKNAWNSVRVEVEQNTPGKADGRVALTINGSTRRFDKIMWSRKRLTINGFAFTTWFGGGSRMYAPEDTQRASFKDITFTKLA